MNNSISLSIIVPVTSESKAITETHGEYRAVLDNVTSSLEFIYVIDGVLPQATEALRSLQKQGESIEIFTFEQPQGQSACLNVGFQRATSDVVLTLGSVPEVMTEDIVKVIAAVTDGADMAVASRIRTPSSSAVIREGKLERIVRFLFKSSFRDIRCGVRAMRSAVAKEVTVYGNQQRFLPLIAQTQGFSVREIDVRPSSELAQARSFIKVDLPLVLDVMTIYFLLKFTKKPFRFFGGFGFIVLILGALVTAYLIFIRLVFGEPLVDRPALILSSLMVVLGIQIISVGLIGEIIAFSYAKDVKDYKVDRIVE